MFCKYVCYVRYVMQVGTLCVYVMLCMSVCHAMLCMRMYVMYEIMLRMCVMCVSM